MKSFIWLALFVVVAVVPSIKCSICATQPWVQINSGPVCFSGKKSQPGTFRVLHAGFVAAVKLVHKSGHIRCGSSSARHNSYFGCHDWKGLEKHSLNVLVTNVENQVKFPVSDVNILQPNRGYWYGLDGFNSVSKEIVLQHDFAHPYYVNANQVLKVWYGEDLKGYTEPDNVGRVCVDVFAYYV